MDSIHKLRTSNFLDLVLYSRIFNKISTSSKRRIKTAQCTKKTKTDISLQRIIIRAFSRWEISVSKYKVIKKIFKQHYFELLLRSQQQLN